MEKFQVVGQGRIGSLLSSHQNAVSIDRNSEINWMEGPIYVCTRNDSLKVVIERTPKGKRQDLVFLQNGMIEPILKPFNLHNNTQALIYFAVQAKGAKPKDGGQTVVSGKWSQHFVGLCESLGLKAKAIPDLEYRQCMFEKLIWNCVFGLFGELYKDSVGQLVEKYHPQISELTEELVSIANRKIEQPLSPGVVERLCSYSKTIAEFKGGLKEYEYRNGYFMKQKVTPVHENLLKQAGIS